MLLSNPCFVRLPRYLSQAPPKPSRASDDVMRFSSLATIEEQSPSEGTEMEEGTAKESEGKDNEEPNREGATETVINIEEEEEEEKEWDTDGKVEELCDVNGSEERQD